MRLPVRTVKDVGVAVLAVRKESRVRQDDAAGSAGVSHVFLRDLERGKDTVQFGRVLQVLDELGIRMVLEVSDDVRERLSTMLSATPPNSLDQTSSQETP